jgi:predicted metalloprotease with PDZ domain
MIGGCRIASAILLFVFSFWSLVPLASGQPNQSKPSQNEAVHYTVSLRGTVSHLVHIEMRLGAGSEERQFQLPVWNALYQVRDFSQYVNWVRAKSSSGKSLQVKKLDKDTWKVSGAEQGAAIEYEIFADAPGPFGAQLDQHHAFFNLAEVLMYPVGAKSVPSIVSFVDVLAGWHAATALATSSSPGEFTAPNYDWLVDSPIEFGSFQEDDFDEGGAHYRVVVDADPADYNLPDIVSSVKRIAAAATSWMSDRPFENYLFIYHFPRRPAGGGMEHAYSTAIDLSADRLLSSPSALADVTSHEFFHLWNVKRIRPQSLEPVDYTRENYTRALWFSEGVTSTAAMHIRFRAGLIDEERCLNALATQIQELDRRAAHLTQSAEESSLDAWLEGNDYYRAPERSISYYNKGFLLGVMLDLAVRQATDGKASLREVFQWLNQNYAKQGRFFPDSEGIREVAEAISHSRLQSFFDKYVSGTEEIPWDDFLRTVGLHLTRTVVTQADPGFTAVRHIGAPPSVFTVMAESEAQRAGLALGDTILEINSHTVPPDLDQAIALMHPGETVHVLIQRGTKQHKLQWKLGQKEEVEFALKDVDNISPQQKARRAAWLKGESEGDAQP